MWEEIFAQALGNGLLAALFVGLLIYVLKDAQKREKKYKELLCQLSEHLRVVNEIKVLTKEMHQRVSALKKTTD